MTKKITAVILSLTISLTLAFASVTGVFAADDAEKTLTVKTTSNLFSSASTTVSADQNQVRVTFMLETATDVLNMDCELIYDPTVLTPVEAETTSAKVLPTFNENGVVFNSDSDLYSLKYGEDDSRRVLAFNASSPSLYKFTDGKKTFATALFDINNSASVDETTVELWVRYLGTASLGSSGVADISTELYPVDNDGEVFGDICAKVVKSASSSSVALPVSPDDPSFKYGDVNQDGYVDISDATAIQKAVAKITELTEIQKFAANVNGDSTLDISDATTIQKFVAKIISVFPVESGE